MKMIKDRKAKEERKIKANPHARKSWADGKKKAHRDKVREAAAGCVSVQGRLGVQVRNLYYDASTHNILCVDA